MATALEEPIEIDSVSTSNDSWLHAMKFADASRFSLSGMLVLTAVVALALFFYSEGNQTDSSLSGVGIVLGSLVLLGFSLYLVTRFLTQPGAIRRIVYAMFVFVVLSFLLVLSGIAVNG